MYDGRLLYRVWASGMVDEISIPREGSVKVRGRWTGDWFELNSQDEWTKIRLTEQRAAKSLRNQIRGLGQRMRWGA